MVNITIETAHGNQTYQVAADCLVRLNSVRSTLDRIMQGAETLPDTDLKVTGIIAGLSLGRRPSMKVLADNGSELTFEINDRTFISLDGQEAFSSDLKPGQTVKIDAR